MDKRPRPEHIEKRRVRVLKTALFIVVLFVLGVVLLSITLFYIMPLGPAGEWAAGRLKERTGLAVTEGSIERSFPFGIEARAVRVNGPGGEPLVYLEVLRARLRPLSLITGKVVLPVNASTNGGLIDGVVTIRPGSTALRLALADVGLSGFPALRDRVELEGLFGGDVFLTVPGGGCPEGFVRLEGTGLKGGRIRFMGMPLPIGGIERAGLGAELKGCKAEVKGLWLEGGDISMRIKGTVFFERSFQESRLDLTVEVIPKGKLLERDYMLRLLEPYRKSANYYLIPVTGTLGRPRAGK